MKIRQNIRHWASRKALTMPVVGNKTSEWLVDLHTRVFLDRAEEGRAAERRAHLDEFFDATMDTYVRALEAGYPEAEAREITHIQANFDFYQGVSTHVAADEKCQDVSTALHNCLNRYTPSLLWLALVLRCCVSYFSTRHSGSPR